MVSRLGEIISSQLIQAVHDCGSIESFQAIKTGISTGFSNRLAILKNWVQGISDLTCPAVIHAWITSLIPVTIGLSRVDSTVSTDEY